MDAQQPEPPSMSLREAAQVAAMAATIAPSLPPAAPAPPAPEPAQSAPATPDGATPTDAAPDPDQQAQTTIRAILDYAVQARTTLNQFEEQLAGLLADTHTEIDLVEDTPPTEAPGDEKPAGDPPPGLTPR